MSTGDPASAAVAAAGRESAAAEWRRAWPLPVVSLVGLAVAFSHIYTMGVFVAPLEAEFGWSRTAIVSGLTIVSVISVVLAPFIGAGIDRFGSRRVAIPGLVLYCGSFAALSFAGSSTWSWWALWALVGFGSVCVKPTVWAAAISTRFDRSRGLAMGVALCGSGLGGFFLPLTATLLIDRIGWRGGYAAIGLIELALVLPLVFLFFRPAATESPGVARARPTAGISFRDAVRSRRFLSLAAANLVVTVALLSVIVHLVPILSERGTGKGEAAAIASLVGLATVVGRLGTGLLLDRFRGNRIGLVVFAIPVVACTALLLDHSQATAMAAAILLGLAVGSEVDVVMYLSSRYFGLRNFGAIYGTLGGLTSLGTGLGPLLGGIVHDAYGSYDPLLLGLLPAFLVAALLVGSLGDYPKAFAEGGH